MAKMVKLLATLQERIIALLREWEDHPGLQKIFDVIDMLLAIPSSTPLAKVVNVNSYFLHVYILLLLKYCQFIVKP